MTNKTEQAKQELSAETLNLLKNNVGVIFKTYINFCNAIKIEPKRNDSKTAQLKKLKQYVKLKQAGQSIEITEYYDIIKPKKDGRTNNKGGNNNKYSDIMDQLVIRLLSSNNTIQMKTFNQIFSEKENIPLYSQIYAESYTKNNKDLFEVFGGSEHLTYLYFLKSKSFVQKAFESSLNRLQKDNVINWCHEIYTYDDAHDNKSIKCYRPKDPIYKQIKQKEKQISKEMNKPIFQILKNPHLKEEFTNTVCDEMDFQSYWYCYYVRFNNTDEANNAINNSKADTTTTKQLIQELKETVIKSIHDSILKYKKDGTNFEPYHAEQYIIAMMRMDYYLWQGDYFIDDRHPEFTTYKIGDNWGDIKDIDINMAEKLKSISTNTLVDYSIDDDIFSYIDDEDIFND